MSKQVSTEDIQAIVKALESDPRLHEIFLSILKYYVSMGTLLEAVRKEIKSNRDSLLLIENKIYAEINK